MHHSKTALLLATALLTLGGCSDHPTEQHAGDNADRQHQAQHEQQRQRLHTHEHDGQGTQGALQLNNGSKWTTDEPLRHAMHAIAEQLHPYQQQSDANADYAALGKGVHDNVEYMIQNCKLEPAADAALHTIIAEMIAGADLLNDTAQRNQGIAKIAAALNSYSQYFDHPGFALH